MSNAWETTLDDVILALGGLDRKVSDEEASKILDSLDADAIEQAALCGDEMEQQTEYAYQEIRRQITEGGA